MASNKIIPFVHFPFFTLLCFVTGSSGDLNSDKKALLAFAEAIHHGRRINWNSNISVCSSWIGITCTPDQSRVTTLRLPAIGIIGHIPPGTLGKLDTLRVLSLRSNSINGSLPIDVATLPSLQYLFLQHNNLSGSLPSMFSGGLSSIDLSYNSFSGGVPPAMHNLKGLTSLNLQSNSLTGPIPDLELSRLKRLNLSYNNLSGTIPSSLQRFPNDSFIGNSLLCGTPMSKCSESYSSPSPSSSPLSSPSPPISPQKHKKLGTWAILAIAAGGFAILLLLSIFLLVCFLKRNKKERRRDTRNGKNMTLKDESSSAVQGAEKNKLFFFEGCSYHFDLEDLLRASAEVLGKGSYGTTYKAVLEDGTAVVVKRLRDVTAGKKEFEQQMDIIGKAGQHPNILPLQACYYSKDEKLLVCDYVPKNSFSDLLHGSKFEDRIALNWESRLRIVLGTAKGIAHIHSIGGPRFAHGNIKSTNIFLTQEQEARVSDFGLSPLMSFHAAVPSRAVVGYHAPETMETRKCTQRSDIYSFGVLLLEMLTGKTPLQTVGKDEVLDLPRWVQSVVREEWTAEVFDEELLRCQNAEQQMVQMLQLALTCVSRLPDQRPPIEEVVRIIEEMQLSPPYDRSSSQ